VVGPVAVPRPLLVIVSHGTLLTAVQVQPVLVVVVIENGPPEAGTVWAVCERVKVHWPLWETVTVCPAIVSVPVRSPGVVFALTLYETVPEPVPLLPLVTVIQLVLLLTPVHAQPAALVTVAVCDPPAGTTV
jgi:hypothetical protein